MMWLDFLIAFSCGGAGVTCGWVMHALNGAGGPVATTPQACSNSHRSGVANGAPSATNESKHSIHLGEVADRLRSYAAAMAADVDAHQTKVQQVNSTLSDGADISPEAVLEAIQQLVRANEGVQSQLSEAQDLINEQALQLESAEKRAETDALTRVPNRAALDRHLAERHALGPQEPTALAMLDVDHFKKFNDVHGHRAGDEVLRVVAGMLHSRLQKHGLVARYGGEEFTIVLDGYEIEKAAELVEAARIAISQREILFEEKRLRVTVSVGIAQLETSNNESLEQCIQRADDGLYQSKESGRDCGHWMAHKTAHRITRASRGVEEGTEGSLHENRELVRCQPTSGPFLDLLDRSGLCEEFDEIRDRTQTSVSLYLMAIRCHCELRTAKARSLLQVVRATLRNVDKLGYEDSTTLLICMPSVDHETACARAHQICRSISAIGLDGSSQGSAESRSLVSIGIVAADEDTRFDRLADRVVSVSDEARDELEAPVLFEDERICV